MVVGRRHLRGTNFTKEPASDNWRTPRRFAGPAGFWVVTVCTSNLFKSIIRDNPTGFCQHHLESAWMLLILFTVPSRMERKPNWLTFILPILPRTGCSRER
ncbi:hypothetical protein BaRGS_00024676 [Batillaria attramentaria]|uniref:Uncharacterized protein n=1 Tax=Batillaria attramentaria TaxID=370345 RepID=A0ABD0KAG9_9CAEN